MWFIGKSVVVCRYIAFVRTMEISIATNFLTILRHVGILARHICIDRPHSFIASGKCRQIRTGLAPAAYFLVLPKLLHRCDSTVVCGQIVKADVTVQHMPGVVVECLGDSVMPDFPDPCRDANRAAERRENRAVICTVGIAVYVHRHDRIMAFPVPGRIEVLEITADVIPDCQCLFLIRITIPGNLTGNALRVEPVVQTINRDSGIDERRIAEILNNDCFINRVTAAIDLNLVGIIIHSDYLRIFPGLA